VISAGRRGGHRLRQHPQDVPGAAGRDHLFERRRAAGPGLRGAHPWPRHEPPPRPHARPRAGTGRDGRPWP
jgi:hypothetical protein